MIVDYEEMVRAFHKKYGHHIGEGQILPPPKVGELRWKLIDEEVSLEVYSALMAIQDAQHKGRVTPELRLNLLTRLADGIADSIYVLVGTGISYNIPVNKVFAEVQRSNMTKSTEKNSYGKTIKGANFELPKIREILVKHLSE